MAVACCKTKHRAACKISVGAVATQATGPGNWWIGNGLGKGFFGRLRFAA